MHPLQLIKTFENVLALFCLCSKNQVSVFLNIFNFFSSKFQNLVKNVVKSFESDKRSKDKAKSSDIN
jgi:hypothetical protein